MGKVSILLIVIVVVTLQQTGSVNAWHEQYHNLDEIYQKLNEINSTYDNAYLFSIGKTAQKREMMAIKITGKKRDNKPVFFILCLLRAREWVASSVCMYLVDELTRNYGNDYYLTALLDKMDFVILPVANPDGYVYTWANDYTRLWQKNRRYLGNICQPHERYGVDLSRNFGYQWHVKRDIHTTANPCHESYSGSGPFSEIETRNIKKQLETIGSNLKGFIDMGAYGRSFFYPWYSKSGDTPDKAEQYRAAVVAIKEVYQRGGYRSSYMIHNAGIVSQFHKGGTSIDWVYGVLGVKYTYEWKLQTRYGYRDGYKLNPVYLVATAKETMIGLRALVETMKV